MWNNISILCLLILYIVSTYLFFKLRAKIYELRDSVSNLFKAGVENNCEEIKSGLVEIDFKIALRSELDGIESKINELHSENRLIKEKQDDITR